MNYGYDIDIAALKNSLEKCKIEIEKINIAKMSEIDNIRSWSSNNIATKIEGSLDSLEEKKKLLKQRINELEMVASNIEKYQEVRKQILELNNNPDLQKNSNIEFLKEQEETLRKILTNAGYPPNG